MNAEHIKQKAVNTILFRNHTLYIAGFSEQLAKDLKVINAGLTFQRGHTIYYLICKPKPSRQSWRNQRILYLSQIPARLHNQMQAEHNFVTQNI